MRKFVVLAGIIAAVVSTVPIAADAQTATAAVTTTPAPPKKKPQPQPQPPVLRSASGTIIQPTRTIIHNPNGTTTVIVVPRRSYLDPGTEVPVGYPRTNDYAFPPGGDPGRPYWYFGPDTAGVGGSPLAQPWLIPGFSPGSPTPY
jgi:hypothetical protein